LEKGKEKKNPIKQKILQESKGEDNFEYYYNICCDAYCKSEKSGSNVYFAKTGFIVKV